MKQVTPNPLITLSRNKYAMSLSLTKTASVITTRLRTVCSVPQGQHAFSNEESQQQHEENKKMSQLVSSNSKSNFFETFKKKVTEVMCCERAKK